MKTLLLNLLFFLLCLGLTSCPDPCLNGPKYNFSIEAHFTPEQDSIQVGDTLYLVSEFPKQLIPHGSQDVVDYADANISGSLTVFELVPNQRFATDAVFSFDYISLAGQIYNSREVPNPNGIQQFNYQELEDKYQVKFAFIPKKKGVYGMGILSTASPIRSGSESCDGASFRTTVSNSDINLNYLEEFNKSNGLPPSPRPDNGFYFKVY